MINFATGALTTAVLSVAIRSATADPACARAGARAGAGASERERVVSDLRDRYIPPSSHTLDPFDYGRLMLNYLLETTLAKDPKLIINENQTLEGNSDLICDVTNMCGQKYDPKLPYNCATVTTVRCMTDLGVANQMVGKQIHFNNGILYINHGQNTKPTPEDIKGADSFVVNSYKGDGKLIKHPFKFPKNSKFTGSIIEFETLNDRPKEGGAVSVETGAGEINIGIVIEVVEKEGKHSNKFIGKFLILKGLEGNNTNKENTNTGKSTVIPTGSVRPL